MTIEYEFARDLAIYLWAMYYKDAAPDWEPLGDLMGVLTQIDNMVTGIKKHPTQQEIKNYRKKHPLKVAGDWQGGHELYVRGDRS